MDSFKNQNININTQDIRVDTQIEQTNRNQKQNEKGIAIYDFIDSQQNNQNQVQNPQKHVGQSKICIGFCTFLFAFLLESSISLAFGILFFLFQRDEDMNDYCENTNYKKNMVFCIFWYRCISNNNNTYNKDN
ncbi:transmembrane protein, putative (macronuclear) [Tetrahymena thermophila SB210]|uniref:Transmembrane protein, putative n=1 Tax=Tetrahymena thermophila (strain SB210) TaxID=312017 RepID=Q247R0_TETTS|nr:transmembrane protein, putative [Tetrahymena thermophila SB210]EAS04040.1 transmembrane protein, putative [Tetrahymena thermophila SB210]|eukprot:XP_001024285.1 transmembrane protein, putative [Tetrahymena thermophila SB210]